MPQYDVKLLKKSNTEATKESNRQEIMCIITIEVLANDHKSEATRQYDSVTPILAAAARLKSNYYHCSHDTYCKQFVLLCQNRTAT